MSPEFADSNFDRGFNVERFKPHDETPRHRLRRPIRARGRVKKVVADGMHQRRHKHFAW